MTQETNEFWWWANGDGALKTVDQFELEAALKRGAIAPRTYVWRSGWAEWVRAAQVAELQTALPKHLASSPVQPRLDPDATHPPPVPASARGKSLEPIIPVASNPNNDKPGTLLMIDVELDENWSEPTRPEPPPPPSRRGGLNGANGMNGKSNGKSSLTPIVPIESNPNNDRPETQVLTDSEIEIEEDEAPAGKWTEVKRPSAPPPPSTRASGGAIARRIINVKGTLDPAPSPAAAAAAALAGRAAPPTAPSAPPPAVQPAIVQAQPPPAQPPLAQTALVQPPVAAPPKPAFAQTQLMPQQAPQPSVRQPPPPPGVQPPVVVATKPIAPSADPENEGPTVAMEPIVPVSEPDNDAPTAIHPSAFREEGGQPLPAWDIDPEGTVERSPQWQAPAHAQQHPGYAAQEQWAAPKKKSKLPLLIGGFLVLGALGVGAAGVALYVMKPWETPAPAATQPAAAAAPAATEAAKPVTSTVACTLAGGGKRVAASAVVSVPVAVAAAPGGALVAIGFADAATNATGITVDAQTLAVKEPFSRAGTKPVVGVIPLVQSGTLAFEVDQAAELTSPRTIDAKQRFTIGLGPDGVSRVVHNGRPETIWADTAGEKITEPRVATVQDGSHVVTFRRGSEVRVGWLEADGKKKSGLMTIGADGARVGTPSVAAGEHGVLVAFAARASDSAPWGVRLALAKPAALPTASTAFEIPSGGPGAEAISPSATALPGGRWLLQWTEGKAGERMVRTQTLGAKLEPLGEAITLSPKGVEAGQGAVAVQGDHAVATYLVKSATGYELHASSLSCR